MARLLAALGGIDIALKALEPDEMPSRALPHLREAYDILSDALDEVEDTAR